MSEPMSDADLAAIRERVVGMHLSLTTPLIVQDDRRALLNEVDRLRAKETEREWEYGEFDSYDLQPDGTLIEWAEPKDSWDEPLSADELAELRAEGGVYARRPKPRPWEPVEAGEPDE